MCDFKPGDEVVCVDARDRPDPRYLPMAQTLREGAVYTVQALYVDSDDGVLTVHLVEAKNPNPVDETDCGFRASRFRKVQRRDLSAWLKTSIGNTDKLDKRQKVKV